MAGLIDYIKNKIPTAEESEIMESVDPRHTAKGGWNAFGERLADNEGMFQGGEKKRLFGRLRDKWDKNPLPKQEEVESIATANRAAIEDQYYKKVQPLNDFVKTMNVEDKEDVKRFQELAGLKVDGMFGPASLKAMRSVQDGSYGNVLLGGDVGFNNFETGSGEYGDLVFPHIRRNAMNDTISSEDVDTYNQNVSNASRRFGYFPTM